MSAARDTALRWGSRRLTVATLTAGALAAGAAAAASLLDDEIYTRLGVPAPGPVVQAGSAALRTTVVLAAALALGSLIHAAFLTPPRPAGTLDVDGYRAVRRAGPAAAVAGAGGLLLAVLSAADLSGAAVPAVVTGPDPLGMLAALEEPMGWLLTGLGFGLVALGCTGAMTWRAAALLVAVAVAALLPPPATGLAAAGRGHDWSTDAAVLQAVAGAVWLGVLAALVAHRRHHGGLAPTVRGRARVVLTAAGLLWVLSSVVLGLVLVVPGSLVDNPWGRWQLVAAGLAIVSAAGWWVAGRRGRGHALLALLACGIVVTAGAMAHSVPPRFLVHTDSSAEVLLGYDLPDPFTTAGALLDWRPNVLFTLAAVVAVAGYLAAVRALRARGDTWPRVRTAAWLGGWAALGIATSSGIGRYAAGTFSVHMLSHMTLTMVCPVLLALGGPVTLALRVLRPAGRGQPPGPREWVLTATTSAAARLLTHPLVAFTLFVGSFYVLYLTPLFGEALRYHWAHQLMNLHFLVTGYVFFWPLIGVDRAPARLPPLGRLALLLAAMPFHAFFGITLMSTKVLVGGEFYRSLALPWLPDLLADQHAGGGIAWATGEIPVLFVVVVLLMQWSHEDGRAAARYDRHAARDDDAELRAYNDMLSQLSRQRG